MTGLRQALAGLARLGHVLAGSSWKAREVPANFGVLGEAYQREWKDIPCLFVLSTGRSGTMTLARALDLSPHIDSYHEPAPTLAHASYLAYMSGDEQRTRPTAWDRVIDGARAEYVAQAWQERRIYVEANNRLSYLAPSLARFFPASRFVFLHRHPYEVIRSGSSRGWYADHPWDWCRIRPRPEDPASREWGTMKPIDKTAWLWKETNEFILATVRSLDADRCLTIRSEDLFQDGPRTLDSVLEFLGLETLEPARVRRVLRRRLNAARPSGATVPDSARRLVADLADELGYEL